jgi:hypothetical protein
MQCLSIVLHGTLGTYLRDAVQEGRCDHPSPEMDPSGRSTQPHDPARAGGMTDHPDACLAANSEPLDQPTAMEEDHPHDKAPTEAQRHTVRRP